MYIKEILSLDLTLAGQIQASVFSDRIIRAADSKLLKYKGTLTNPFAYFMKVCNEISREKNIQPDYDLANDLHAAFGTSGDMPMLNSIGRNPRAILAQKTADVLAPVVVAMSLPNPFKEYYATLDADEREKYDNDVPPTGYRHATPKELAALQNAFLRVPVTEEVLKTLPIGYADKAFANLRFIELQVPPKHYQCPCAYRRKFNKDHQCMVSSCHFFVGYK